MSNELVYKWFIVIEEKRNYLEGKVLSWKYFFLF